VRQSWDNASVLLVLGPFSFRTGKISPSIEEWSRTSLLISSSLSIPNECLRQSDSMSFKAFSTVTITSVALVSPGSLSLN